MKQFLALMVLCFCMASAIPARARLVQKHDAPSAQRVEALDINHASADALMKIPGMTRVWAERIVRFRPYRAKNQILLDGIVPRAVYDRIKDRIVAHREPK